MVHLHQKPPKVLPEAKICDTRLVFYIRSLPTHPPRHIASCNDIHIKLFINIHNNLAHTLHDVKPFIIMIHDS